MFSNSVCPVHFHVLKFVCSQAPLAPMFPKCLLHVPFAQNYLDAASINFHA